MRSPASEGPAGTDASGAARVAAEFAADVGHYLTLQPYQLPSRYLYDELGSALFEAICCLPWYPITRAEARLLDIHGSEILRRAGPMSTIVELGSGSGHKLRTLLTAAPAESAIRDIHLVDLSPAALALATRTLASFERLRVTTHAAPYEAGLHAAAQRFAPGGPVLVLFLGSNIGNFDPPACLALLRDIRRELRPGDALLLGADLVKPQQQLQLAYDDPLGVTAAFNRNLLVRVNRELGADFQIEQFAHRAVWSGAASRVEMHLVALADQQIRVPAAGLRFSMKEGEAIWTESSYKFRADEIADRLGVCGFRPMQQWIDEPAQFALTLSVAA